MSERPERPASRKGGDDDVTSAKKQPFAMCWECHEKLGSGQFADVFRATEKRPKDRLRPRIVGALCLQILAARGTRARAGCCCRRAFRALGAAYARANACSTPA